MNSENNKEIFERKSIHKLLKEGYEYNLSLEYPDESDNESEIDYLQEFTKFGELAQYLKKEKENNHQEKELKKELEKAKFENRSLEEEIKELKAEYNKDKSQEVS